MTNNTSDPNVCCTTPNIQDVAMGHCTLQNYCSVWGWIKCKVKSTGILVQMQEPDLRPEEPQTHFASAVIGAKVSPSTKNETK